jgi:hypothetical protein
MGGGVANGSGGWWWQWLVCNKIPYNKIKGDAKPNGGRGVAEASRKKRVSQYHCKYQEKLEGKKRVVFDPSKDLGRKKTIGSGGRNRKGKA